MAADTGGYSHGSCPPGRATHGMEVEGAAGWIRSGPVKRHQAQVPGRAVGRVGLRQRRHPASAGAALAPDGELARLLHDAADRGGEVVRMVSAVDYDERHGELAAFRF